MSSVRWLIVIFWLVVLVLLFREFFLATMVTNNKPILAPGVNLPVQVNTPPPPPKAEVVEQSWEVGREIPGMITIHLALKNQGGATAHGVQAFIAPYLGAVPGTNGDVRMKTGAITADSPLGQIGQWVNYGDLGPGQSATNSAMFPANPSVDPVSSNPHPKLLYTDGNP